MYEPHERLGSDSMGGFESLKSHRYFNSEYQTVDLTFERSAVRIPRYAKTIAHNVSVTC